MIDHPTFSLLHATYRAGEDAVDIRKTWMSRADRPDRVQHIFAFDEDDEVSVNCMEIRRSGISLPAMPGKVSAVRNWNAAAFSAKGDLLFVVADDLLPPRSWDSEILRLIGALDPTASAFVLKVCDASDGNDRTIRHPIISRAHFERFGLWNAAYTGHGVDIEFTHDAHRRGLVLDARSIRFQHLHPSEGSADNDSHTRMRDLSSGNDILDSRIPEYKRYLRKSYVKTRPGRTDLLRLDRRLASGLALSGYLYGVLPERHKKYLRRILHSNA